MHEDDQSRVEPLEAGADRQDLPHPATGRKSSLTDEQRALYLAVEEVLRQHQCAFDDMCSIYAEAFEDDSEAADDAQVKSLLHEAAVSLRHAGMDWYVSTK